MIPVSTPSVLILAASSQSREKLKSFIPSEWKILEALSLKEGCRILEEEDQKIELLFLTEYEISDLPHLLDLHTEYPQLSKVLFLTEEDSPDEELQDWYFLTWPPSQQEIDLLLKSVRELHLLREKEEKFKSFLDQAFQFIYLLEPDGSLIESGQELIQPEAKLSGKKLWESSWWSFSEEAQEKLKESVQKAGRGESLRFEIEIRQQENRAITLDFSLHPIFDKRGEVTLLVARGKDITEKKKAEEKIHELNRNLEEKVEERTRELKKSKSRLSFLLTNSPAIIFTTTYEDFQTTFITENVEEIMGWEASKFLQEPLFWRKQVHPEDLEKAEEKLANFLPQKTVELEFRFRHPHGHYQWTRSVNKVLFDEEGHPDEILGYWINIESEKQAQMDREKARRAAEEANRAKSEFLANVSHEIRTPMNALIGMNYLLKRTDLSEVQADYANKMHSASLNLLAIINDLLDFSKIEAGKLELEVVPFDLEELVRNIAELFLSRACEKDLEILVKLDRDIPIHLKGDPLRLQQIISNFLSNAIKFTEEGEIELNSQCISLEEDRVTLKISIRDTGIGMTQEQMDKLFTPFTQADASTTRKYGGTGLGLSICQRLVRLMDGEIDIESTPGEGSTFSFTVTFDIQDQPESQHIPPEKIENLKVLVVEDGDTAREVLTSYLESFTFEAIACSTGEKALEKVEESNSSFDLFIIDWRLPGMNGMEFLHKVREKGIEAPAIILSAYEREEIMKKPSPFPPEAFLNKPVTPSVLFESILKSFGECPLPTQVSSPSEPRPKSNEYRDLDVLLVEDNELNQQVAREILEGEGIKVTIANNGREAVTMVEEFDFDCVFMDIQMPEMDGYEATRYIRNELEKKDLPILAMTAHAMSPDREKSLAAGMNDHLTKPLQIEALFAALSRHVITSQEKYPLSQNREQTPDSHPSHKPGLNIQKGIKRLQGKKDLYFTLLKRFSQNYSSIDQKIFNFLKKGKMEEGQELLHTLKGVAGNLAAEEVYRATETLESSLKNGGEWKKPWQTLSESTSRLIRSIGEILEEFKKDPLPSEKKEINMEEVDGLLKKIDGFLRENDAAALEVLKKLEEKNLPPALARDIRDLNSLMSQYDFEEARKKIDNIDYL